MSAAAADTDLSQSSTPSPSPLAASPNSLGGSMLHRCEGALVTLVVRPVATAPRKNVRNSPREEGAPDFASAVVDAPRAGAGKLSGIGTMPAPQCSLKLAKEEIGNAFASPGWAEKYPPVLTVGQAAELLSVPVKTIYDWSSRGLLTSSSRRVGKHLRIWRDRLIAHIFNEGLSNNG